jgi:hypothetical protein
MTVGAYDNGSCCNSSVEFVKMTGYVGQAAVFPNYDVEGGSAPTSYDAAGAPMVAVACVAGKSATAGTAGASTVKFGQSSFDLEATKYMSWWCSNGLYNKITSGSAGVANTTQTFQMNSNQRKELA